MSARTAPAGVGIEPRKRMKMRGALQVPQIGVCFWMIKALSTAIRESTSDYLVHAMSPYIAVLIGLVCFLAALAWQLRRPRYAAAPYWLAVVMVGVFGTMAADALHVGLGVPYTASTILYAVVLAAVFAVWWGTERTLSIHTINTLRRELFYWAAVLGTFAMGTALGDFAAMTLGIGYLDSGLMFAAVIAVPAVGCSRLRWNPILSFWLAYVATRPLGASFADWTGKPVSVGALGLGDGPVALVLGVAIAILLTYLAITRGDVQAVHVPHAQSGPVAEPVGSGVE